MTDPTTPADPAGTDPAAADPAERPKLRELNETIRYVLYAVFSARPGPAASTIPDAERASAAAEVDELIETYAGKGVETRGAYDVSGFRADADIMLWWVAPSPELLQEINAAFRRTRLGRTCAPVWNAMALHRPAEFNRSHVPAYLLRSEPKRFVCVYPFVRSYEWYLLAEDERRALLAEHGAMARDFTDVRTNTAAAFALGDYEWLLAFEADELHRIVDLMRHLRGAAARRHTRVEIPFYTGTRKPISELVAALP